MSGFTEIDVPETMHIASGADAETPASDDAAPREPSPREIAMAAIAERRREAIERELAYGVEMEDEARASGGGEPLDRAEPTEQHADGLAGAEGTPSPRAPEPMGASGALVPDAPAPSDERRHPITLNGQQYLVNDSELAHLASIGAYAVQQHQQPQPQAQPVARREVPQPQDAPQAQPALDRERAAGLVRRMSYGDEAEGVAAIQELAELMRPAPVDTRQLVEQAKAETFQQMQLQQNLQQIGREYPDVFGPIDRQMTPQEAAVSQSRAQLAALQLHEIRGRDAALGIQRSDLEAYREAANRVRASVGLSLAPQSGQQAGTQPASQAARTVIATSNERLERKRAAPRQPQAVSRTATAEPQYRAPTASEVVAQIARARHQVSPVRV